MRFTLTKFTLILLVGLLFTNNLQAQPEPAQTDMENPLLRYVTDDCLALILARPRSLIEDTEQEILGDVPFLGQLPIPPSEIEHLAVLVNMRASGEPGVAIGFHFRREFPIATLRRWLAPNSVEVAGSVPTFTTPSDDPGFMGPAHLAIPTPLTALLSFDPALLDQLLHSTDLAKPTGALARQSQQLVASVNFAAMVDAGQIRMFTDSIPPFARIDAARDFNAFPAELSIVSLESIFGKQVNTLHLRFTERDDLPATRAVRDWADSAAVGFGRVLDDLTTSVKRDLPTNIDVEIEKQLAKAQDFFASLRPVASEKGLVYEVPQAPSFSRALSHAVSGMYALVLTARDSARRMQFTNNFKQTMLAWHSYHDRERQFPGDITDNAGKPLLSWRVRILPMLNQEALFNEFHLDEPWDSQHNATLLEKMPMSYASPWHPEETSATQLQGVTGQGTVLSGPNTFSTVTDGSSNTVVLVAAAKPVPWTKPADVPLGPSMADALAFHGDSVPLAFLDGAVSRYGKLSDEVYHKLFVINDGQQIEFGELDDQPSAIDEELEASFHMDIADVPEVLTKLQSDDHESVRKAAIQLLVSQRNFSMGARHRMGNVMLAWQNHYETYAQFPLDIASKDGKAGLSWRVRILPFLEEQDLYKQFRLDEPWDSPHNKPLVEKMPLVFQDHENQLPAGSTRILAVHGKGTVIGDRVKMNAVVDGMSHTAALVEAKNSVVWTKPEDLSLQNEFGTKLHLNQSQRTVIGMLDGMVLGFAPLTDDQYRNLFFYKDQAPLELPDAAEATLQSPVADQIYSVVLGVLENKNPYIRAWAARLFFNYAPDDAYLNLQLLESLLNDPNREVRRYAISQLEHHESPEVARLLFRLRGSDQAVVDGLLKGTLRGVAADALVPFLSSQDARDRGRAAGIIGATGNRSHLAVLSLLLDDPQTSDAVQAATDSIATRFPLSNDPADDPQNAQQMIDRQQLWTTGQQLLKDQKFDEGLAAIRQMLDVERKIFGEAHKEVLDTLKYLADNYNAHGRATEAADMLKLRADTVAKTLGVDSFEARNELLNYHAFKEMADLTDEQRKEFADAEQLQQQAVEQVKAQQMDMAISSIRQSIEAKRSLFGKDSVRLLPPLRYLRQQLFDAKQMQAARDVGVEVVRIVSQLLGADAPVTQTDRSELAYLDYFLGNKESAVQQLIALQEIPADASNAELMARDSFFIAGQLLNRGHMPQALGFLQKSLQLHDQSNKQENAGEVCATLAAHANRTNTDDAYSWRSDSVWRYQQQSPYQGLWSNYPPIADSMHEAGKYHLELMLRKALVDALKQGVEEKHVGLLTYAKALDALAGTYITLGDFVLADESLSECSRIVGDFRDDAFVIELLAHRASIRVHLGDMDSAEKLLLEAQQQSQKENPAFQAQMPIASRRLADFYAVSGRPDQALSWLNAALEAQQDKSSAEYLRALVSLAGVQILSELRVDAIATAEAGSEKLLSATLSAADLVELYGDYGRLWLKLDEVDKAEQMALSAQMRCKQHFGEDTLSYSQSQTLLARIQLKQQKLDEAKQTALSALHTTRRVVEQSAYLLSPRQQLAFGDMMRTTLDLVLSIAATDPDAAADCFAEIFQWKGAGMVRLRAVHQLAEKEGVAPFYEQLSSITRQLSNVVRQSEGSLEATDVDPNAPAMLQELQASQKRLFEQEQAIKSLSQFKDLLEGQLSASRLAYMDIGERATVKDFIAALPAESMFIDYFVYQREPLQDNIQPSRSLLASVIGQDGSVTVHELGEMASIEAAIQTWRASLGASAESIRAGELLRSRLWDPLLPRIQQATTILISPDDSLGQLPFHALPSQDGKRYLIEDHRLALIAVPQLVPELLKRHAEPKAGQLLLVGDVAYDAHVGEPAQAATSEEIASKDPASGSRRATLGRAIRRGAIFAELPGTRDEIAAVEALFAKTNGPQTKQDALLNLSRSEASESAFRHAASNYATIHIATHGFFAPPEEQATQVLGVQAFNPGLLSGLVFAGANQTQGDSDDDGVLTADEISTLKLESVELAVLSACETGLGRVAGGEGLLGIQRSFQVSGVGATVASLWQVPDQATRVLMERFYRNYWQEKMSRLDSLREAQIFLLNTPEAINDPELARGVRRNLSVSPNPNSQRLPPQSWAAFVLAGDWR